MSLIKWEPFEDFDHVFREMSNMNYDLACDVYESDGNLVAEMNIPGMNGEDIDVEVENNHLRVSGKREEVEEKEEKSHYAKEIRRGSFERVVPLPEVVAQDKVEAAYENGVLTVTMPKKEADANNKVKVEVKK